MRRSLDIPRYSPLLNPFISLLLHEHQYYSYQRRPRSIHLICECLLVAGAKEEAFWRKNRNPGKKSAATQAIRLLRTSRHYRSSSWGTQRLKAIKVRMYVSPSYLSKFNTFGVDYGVATIRKENSTSTHFRMFETRVAALPRLMTWQLTVLCRISYTSYKVMYAWIWIAYPSLPVDRHIRWMHNKNLTVFSS